ncbi:MAG: hypothetical protein K0Q78_734 [Cellvibrio sp.]|jgi:hypothetical protein|nr:hypothetical protein [Cellvibrio sp.]
MSKKITKNHVKGLLTAPEFNVSKVRAFTDSEAEDRAKKDPDAPIISANFAKKGRKINQQ